MANNEERTTEQIRKQSYLHLNEIWIPKKLLKQKDLEIKRLNEENELMKNNLIINNEYEQKLQELQKELKELLMDGWSERERKLEWQSYLEEEVKPHFPKVFELFGKEDKSKEQEHQSHQHIEKKTSEIVRKLPTKKEKKA